jgi:hypothetical protein
MAKKHPKRPHHLSQVQSPGSTPLSGKFPELSASKQPRGRKGEEGAGEARARALTPERRSEIARLAALTRCEECSAASPKPPVPGYHRIIKHVGIGAIFSQVF